MSGEEIRRQAAKWFKVYRTICEMAKDRGYGEEAESNLNQIKTKDLENLWIQNTLSQIQNNLNIPQFAHDSNNSDLYKELSMEQHLYVFHCPHKLTDQIIQMYDNTIYSSHEGSLSNNPNLNIFVNVVILVPEEKDVVPKKVQDIFKDRIELFEKRQVELNSNSRKITNIPTIRIDDKKQVQVFYKYEVFFFDDLVINITKHQLVPKHVPLNAIEKKKLMDKYNINDAQLPKILQSDPITKYFGLRIKQVNIKLLLNLFDLNINKQVFKIERDSETAGKYITYRIVS